MVYLKMIINTGSDMDSMKERHLNREEQPLQHPVHLEDFSHQSYDKYSNVLVPKTGGEWGWGRSRSGSKQPINI